MAGCSSEPAGEEVPGAATPPAPEIPLVAQPTPVPWDVKDPILVDVPEGWTVDYKGKQGIPLYTIESGDGEMRLLAFSRWPASDDPTQIPRLMKVLADGFVSQSVDREDLRLESPEYDVETFEGEEFEGQYVVFKVPDETQVLFVMSAGEGIWNGHFAGSPEAWPAVLEVLKKLKQND